MAFVTPTDRPKSIYNRCVIEDLSGVFVLLLFKKNSVGFDFRLKTESDIFLFLFMLDEPFRVQDFQCI